MSALFSLSGLLQAAPPPQAGSPAPAFTLPDAGGTPRSLAEWRGKWVVLYFYPKDDTPGCTTEAINFRDNLPRLAALNAQVVGVSLDTAESHRHFAAEKRLPFPLLADTEGQVARLYGTFSNWGLLKFAKRHTYLIDPDGRIAKAYRQVDAARHVEEVAADLKALEGAK